jgi:release factor glutamine methyltransferase
MSQADDWTILRLLSWTADFLRQKGADSPRLDAELLLAEARRCERIDLYASFDQKPDEATRAAFRELVRRRAEGTPVAYLLGRREFYSLSFRVTPDVLIPRPETEFVVVALLDRAKQREADGRPVRIADVGTGSGILAVCAAKYVEGAEVTAIDLSAAALAVARSNAADHGVADRITFLEGDLLEASPKNDRYDFIVSNPPYVSEEEMKTLAREVRDHEPHLALTTGGRGVAIVERLIPQTAERLTPGGWLAIEISPMIEAETRQLIEADARLQIGPTIKDLAGLARVVQARRA